MSGRLTDYKGKIVIISSPSGGGKTSICRKLLSPTRKKQGWQFSVSHTTRNKRPGERDGREYHFLSQEEFHERREAGMYAEACKVHLYWYGTPREPLDRVVRKGGVMLLDVDVQGAFKIKEAYPHAITIFVLPPSVTELKRRLTTRGTETPEQLKVRFENARKEMQLFKNFEYAVVNKELTSAVRQVLHIVEAHHCRVDNFDEEQIKKMMG